MAQLVERLLLDRNFVVLNPSIKIDFNLRIFLDGFGDESGRVRCGWGSSALFGFWIVVM